MSDIDVTGRLETNRESPDGPGSLVAAAIDVVETEDVTLETSDDRVTFIGGYGRKHFRFTIYSDGRFYFKSWGFPASSVQKPPNNQDDVGKPGFARA